MFSDDYSFIISLIRKSIFDKDCKLTSFNDLKEVYGIITRCGILLTVYPVIKEEVNSGNSSEQLVKLEELLRKRYMIALRQSIIQGYEGELVLNKLSENGFDCIGLKGWELRKMYPEVTMRQMTDLDILVRPYDYKKIKSVMEELGYTADESESSWKHDDFRKNEVFIEMHKRLTDDSDLIKEWENEMWSKAVNEDGGNVYKMTNEDFYIFHFVHLHKDFMNGSLGLRRLIDTWLLNKDNYNCGEVETELEKLGLLKFKNRICVLCEALMGEREFDENSEIMLSHALSFGMNGTYSSYKAGRIASMGSDSIKSGKFRSLISAVFLPYKRMKAQFPVLNKHPYLLPFCWVKRALRILKSGVKKNSQLLDYSDISQAEFDEMKRFFDAGGVNE